MQGLRYCSYSRVFENVPGAFKKLEKIRTKHIKVDASADHNYVV